VAKKEESASNLADALKALRDALKRAEELGLEVPGGIERQEGPEWNRGAHDLASGGRHDVAAAHGFSKEDVDGETVVYTHPKHGTLFMYGDGEWEHLSPQGASTKGSGADDLKRHLSSP
jgi:hypothetical protein